MSFISALRNRSPVLWSFEEAKVMALSNRSYDFTDYDMVVIEKRDREIAKNMLENNEPVEKISYYTGLTIEEVEELKKNLK